VQQTTLYRVKVNWLGFQHALRLARSIFNTFSDSSIVLLTTIVSLFDDMYFHASVFVVV